MLTLHYIAFFICCFDSQMPCLGIKKVLSSIKTSAKLMAWKLLWVSATYKLNTINLNCILMNYYEPLCTASTWIINLVSLVVKSYPGDSGVAWTSEADDLLWMAPLKHPHATILSSSQVWRKPNTNWIVSNCCGEAVSSHRSLFQTHHSYYLLGLPDSSRVNHHSALQM